MAEPQDAVLPILARIQSDLSDLWRDMASGFNRLETKVNVVAEAVAGLRVDVAEIRKETLLHLGLTARYRIDFEELKKDVKALKSRVAALESQS